MHNATVLVVDDEPLICWSLSERLAEEGLTIIEANDGATAAAKSVGGVDLVLLDWQLPDTDGLTLMRKLRTAGLQAPVILMTGHSSVERAVEAMKEGAYHYVTKPLNLDEIVLLVDKALETTRLRREVQALRATESAPYTFEHIIGESPTMQRAKNLLRKIAATPGSTILLTGESGTGKDLAAKAIHYNSDRARKRFVNITCSALQDTLLESELFGHEKGAFTDASGQKKGLLEIADGGTVFLDEIGETSPGFQAKLLRFLEDRKFKRVGGTTDISVDVRVIAATNRVLEDRVKIGDFRSDLYYRLRVLPVELPPVRQRHGDIPVLVNFFIDRFNSEFRKHIRGVDDECMTRLAAYEWPGNVRELRNAVERAMLLADGEVLAHHDFLVLDGALSVAEGAFQLPAEGLDFAALERDLVRQALQRVGGNQTRAAKLLGMTRDQMRYRVEKFEM